MKKTLFATLFLTLVYTAKSQVALGYFPFNYSKVQITSNPQYLLFGDLRVETNSLISNLNIDFGLNFNLQRKDKYNLYIGPGFSGNPVYNDDNSNFLQGYSFTVGVRWLPIEKLKSLGVIFEIAPYADQTFESGRINSNLGISYHFGRK